VEEITRDNDPSSDKKEHLKLEASAHKSSGSTTKPRSRALTRFTEPTIFKISGNSGTPHTHTKRHAGFFIMAMAS